MAPKKEEKKDDKKRDSKRGSTSEGNEEDIILKIYHIKKYKINPMMMF